MAKTIFCHKDWCGCRDQEGHRTYQVTFNTLGETGTTLEEHLATEGLPKAGEVMEADFAVDAHAVCIGLVGQPKPLPDLPPGLVGWQLTFGWSTKFKFDPPPAEVADEPVMTE